MLMQHREMLRSFYDDSLLTPELLCLNCARSSWNTSSARCDEAKRRDCLVFASDMLNELGKARPASRPLGSRHRAPVGSRP